MSNAIVVENVSKSYRIGTHLSKGRRNLGDIITGTITAPWHHLRQGAALGRTQEFWALRDINFEVRRGEVVGIIGRNGAGKSTLLKILSRITLPTRGRAILRGRVASLLEVGTGFHEELTGRENVFFNGAILGMSRSEIRSKFDTIAEFSGVESFLDTPVKRYSSGMRVRLAFAVAAHLDPEILLIDEVLAVGDVEFQKRCLGKMREVATEGRTVLFVSHNMSAVQNLCSRGIVLREGRVVADEPVAEAVRAYLGHLTSTAGEAYKGNGSRSGDGAIRVTGVRALDECGQPADYFVAGKPMTFEFRYANPRGVRKATLCFTIYNHLGVAATHCSTAITGDDFDPAGEGTVWCHIPRLALPVGQYCLAVAIHIGRQDTDLVENALVFNVGSSVFYSTGLMPPIQYCACMLDYQWSHAATGCVPSQRT